jgi:hypothetical protein
VTGVVTGEVCDRSDDRSSPGSPLAAHHGARRGSAPGLPRSLPLPARAGASPLVVHACHERSADPAPTDSCISPGTPGRAHLRATSAPGWSDLSRGSHRPGAETGAHSATSSPASARAARRAGAPRSWPSRSVFGEPVCCAAGPAPIRRTTASPAAMRLSAACHPSCCDRRHGPANLERTRHQSLRGSLILAELSARSGRLVALGRSL